MYLQNKYTTWYYKIINKAKNRTIAGYTEKHHIIPRSLGGKNRRKISIELGISWDRANIAINKKLKITNLLENQNY